MIEFDKVGKTYPNGFNALKDVNLKIEQGEFVAIWPSLPDSIVLCPS